jgi:hypothetical protein
MFKEQISFFVFTILLPYLHPFLIFSLNKVEETVYSLNLSLFNDINDTIKLIKSHGLNLSLPSSLLICLKRK